MSKAMTPEQEAQWRADWEAFLPHPVGPSHETIHSKMKWDYMEEGYLAGREAQLREGEAELNTWKNQSKMYWNHITQLQAQVKELEDAFIKGSGIISRANQSLLAASEPVGEVFCETADGSGLVLEKVSKSLPKGAKLYAQPPAAQVPDETARLQARLSEAERLLAACHAAMIEGEKK